MNRFEAFPVVGEYDVVVVGGGSAGTAAAVSAAKEGAKVLLLEEMAHLGGTAAGAQIGMYMGFAQGEGYAPQKGMMKEIMEGLLEEKATPGVQTIYLCGKKELDVDVIPYEPEALVRILHRIVKASGADVLLHTRVIGTVTEDGKITEVVFHNEEGIQRVACRTVIDASFHGFVSVDAGCRFKTGDDQGVLQPGTLMYQMTGVAGEVYDNISQPEKVAIAKEGIDAGVLKVNNLLARPLPNGMRYCNMSRLKVDPLNTAQWTDAEMEAHEQVKAISDYFIAHVPGFEKATMTNVAAKTGLRDSRRIMGRYVLKNEDVLEGIPFEDAVVCSSYPIDVHDANGVDSVVKKPKSGVFYIPYRSMVTEEVSNLVLAGRLISTEYEAHASIRVMITCIRLGEVAGMAAAESVKSGVPCNRLDGTLLKKRIFG